MMYHTQKAHQCEEEDQRSEDTLNTNTVRTSETGETGNLMCRGQDTELTSFPSY